MRLPSISWESDDGVIITLPCILRGRESIFFSFHFNRRRSHIGWGRQFLPGDQPWWANFFFWGHM